MFTRQLVLAAALTAVLGCSGSPDDRQEVSGKVTLKGQPIKDGALIDFSPLENQSTGVNAVITGGVYRIPRQSGLKPGKYLVRVSAGDGKTAINPLNPDAPPGPSGGTNIISKDLVPKDWNVNSKQQVAVTSGGPNTFDFAIP